MELLIRRKERTITNGKDRQGVQYRNRYTAYGVDLSKGRPAVSLNGGILHASGFAFSLEGVRVVGSPQGFQQSSVELGYELTLGERVSLSSEFTHSFYSSDTINALAGLANSLSVGIELDFDLFSVSGFLNRFLDGSGATYYGLAVSGFARAGDVLVIPLVQASFVSQTVPGIFLKSNKGKSKIQIGPTTTTVTGFVSLPMKIRGLGQLGRRIDFQELEK